MKAISLYIHIPFCIKKCGYCDFLSFEYNQASIEKYVKALVKEIEIYGKNIQRPVYSVFFGGGTPSLLSAEMMTKIMNTIYEHFHILEDAEISMEMNPGTVTEKTLVAYKKAGINRISLGVQTMDNEMLKVLDRIHDVDAVKSSVALFNKVGLANYNLDLMFGLPGQTMALLENTLEEMIQLNPTHISAYSLKFEEGTPFYEKLEKKELIEIEDELDRQMYHYIEEKLSEVGFIQYEISNFSKKGFECKHNLVYWQKKDYLGIGLGSHGYNEMKRYHNAEDFENYYKLLEDHQLPIVSQNDIDLEEDMFEYIILNLRLNQGMDLKEFKIRYQKNFLECHKDILDDLLKNELLIIEGNQIKLTAKGRDLSNQVFINFL